jgi:hypothetical protein
MVTDWFITIYSAGLAAAEDATEITEKIPGNCRR